MGKYLQLYDGREDFFASGNVSSGNEIIGYSGYTHHNDSETYTIYGNDGYYDIRVISSSDGISGPMLLESPRHYIKSNGDSDYHYDSDFFNDGKFFEAQDIGDDMYYGFITGDNAAVVRSGIFYKGESGQTTPSGPDNYYKEYQVFYESGDTGNTKWYAVTKQYSNGKIIDDVQIDYFWGFENKLEYTDKQADIFKLGTHYHITGENKKCTTSVYPGVSYINDETKAVAYNPGSIKINLYKNIGGNDDLDLAFVSAYTAPYNDSSILTELDNILPYTESETVTYDTVCMRIYINDIFYTGAGDLFSYNTPTDCFNYYLNQDKTGFNYRAIGKTFNIILGKKGSSPK